MKITRQYELDLVCDVMVRNIKRVAALRRLYPFYEVTFGVYVAPLISSHQIDIDIAWRDLRQLVWC